MYHKIRIIQIRFIVIFILTFCFIGCSKVRVASKKSASKLFETFYVGQEGIQYFIKPLTFHATSKQKLAIDFTFRVKKNVQENDSVVANFSLSATHLIKDMDSLVISSPKGEVFKLIYEDQIFREKKSDLFTSRFSTRGRLKKLISISENPNWTLTVFHRGKKKITYTTSKSTQNKIVRLRDNLFSIL